MKHLNAFFLVVLTSLQVLQALSTVRNNDDNWDPRKTLRVGYLVFPGYEPLDVFGPIEMLQTLTSSYNITLSMISFNTSVVSAYPLGPGLLPTHSFENAPEVDVLISPGGVGLNWVHSQNDTRIEDFVRARARTMADKGWILSVCTGAVTLAKAGVLAGKRATTNKWAWSGATRPANGQNITWVASARWVQDGNVWTSSGVAAGMDMLYAFLTFLYGHTPSAQKNVDDMMNIIEYAPHSDPEWDPFSAVWKVPGAINHTQIDCIAPAGYTQA